VTYIYIYIYIWIHDFSTFSYEGNIFISQIQLIICYVYIYIVSVLCICICCHTALYYTSDCVQAPLCGTGVGTPTQPLGMCLSGSSNNRLRRCVATRPSERAIAFLALAELYVTSLYEVKRSWHKLICCMGSFMVIIAKFKWELSFIPWRFFPGSSLI
jgi:hypothetical protein